MLPVRPPGKASGPLNVSLGIKLWILTACVLFSIIVGLGAAFLVYAPGHIRTALLTAGGAFGGCMLLCLAVAAFVLGDRHP